MSSLSRKAWVILFMMPIVAMVVMGFGGPKVGFRSNALDAGLSSDLSTGGSAFQDVDLETLGKDLVAGEYWTPVVDFSAATKYYFKPGAPTGGDGSYESPFRSLELDIAKISQYDDTYTKINSGVVDVGDVAVLLGGNHGSPAFMNYHFSDWTAFVGAPGQNVEYDYFEAREFERFYIKNLKAKRILRKDYALPGNDGSDPPMQMYLRGSTSGTMAYGVIVQDCRFGVATEEEASAWPDSATFNRNVVDGMYYHYVNHGQLQGNEFVAVSGGMRGDHHGSINVINNVYRYATRSPIYLAYCDTAYVAGNNIENLLRCGPDAHGNGISILSGATSASVVENNRIILSTILDRGFGYADETGGIGYGIVYYSPGVGNHISPVIRNNVVAAIGWGGIAINSSTNGIMSNNTLVSLNSDPSVLPGVGTVVPILEFSGASTVGAISSSNIGGIVKANSSVPIAEYTEARCYEYSNDFTSAGFTSWSGAPGTFDLSLKSSSILVDAGSIVKSYSYDYSGNCRYKGLWPDAGAYEYADGNGCAVEVNEMSDSWHIEDASSCWSVDTAIYSTTSGREGLFDHTSTLVELLTADKWKDFKQAPYAAISADSVVYTSYWKNDDINDTNNMMLAMYNQDVAVTHSLRVHWTTTDELVYSLATNVDDYGIDDIGGGWYRIWIFIDLASAGEVGDVFRLQTKTSETNPVVGEGFFVGGYQVEYGVSTPGPYKQVDCP